MARVAVLVVAATCFHVAASQHASRVNTFKARGDQSGYLYDAEILYANWHGQQPPRLVDRNRMPLYGAYLALFYRPTLTDDQFFQEARAHNIWLSLLLLFLLWVVFSRYLPPLLSTNLTLVIASGYFVFRAGYVQAELLFYFLFFLTFVVFHALLGQTVNRSMLWLGCAGGALAGLAQLTKAAVLPLVGILVAVSVVRAAVHIAGRTAPGRVSGRLGGAALKAGPAILVVVCMLAVLWPYLSNSKRVFGRYFYNVNTTFYVWCDDWPQASITTYLHKDHVRWPDMAATDLPSMGRYWREHTVGQIVSRVAGGFQDMVLRSYQTFWYLKYVTMFVAFGLLLAVSNWREFTRRVRANAAQSAFVLLYAGVYLVAIAFYSPVSGTGTARFLQAHIAPALFLLSRFFASAPFSGSRWTIAGVEARAAHLHLLVSATVAFDLGFTLWPRLMTTYGGF